jgi:ElaB/YqjD/DUF883 family membrane-anchored ribosome-binding protein
MAESTLQTEQEHADSSPALTMAAAQDMVAGNPVAAVLASAAVGAGLVALLSLMGRDASIPSQIVDKSKAASNRAYSNLQAQISELAEMVAAVLPSKGDAQRATNNVSDRASDAWSDVRKQAQSVIDQAAPQVRAATAIARENPMWLALGVGVLGALLGSQMLGPKKDSAA